MNRQLILDLEAAADTLEDATYYAEAGLLLKAVAEIKNQYNTIKLMAAAKSPREFFGMRDRMVAFEQALQTRDL